MTRNTVLAITIALLTLFGVASIFYWLSHNYYEEEDTEEDLDFDDSDDYFTEEDNVET